MAVPSTMIDYLFPTVLKSYPLNDPENTLDHIERSIRHGTFEKDFPKISPSSATSAPTTDEDINRLFKQHLVLQQGNRTHSLRVCLNHCTHLSPVVFKLLRMTKIPLTHFTATGSDFVTDVGLRALADRVTSKQLECIRLRECELITDEGIIAMFGLEHGGGGGVLREVEISSAPGLTTASLDAIAAGCVLATSVTLSSNPNLKQTFPSGQLNAMKALETFDMSRCAKIPSSSWRDAFSTT
eukprot:PhF_6_TR37219/c0_g1_i2/m.54889